MSFYNLFVCLCFLDNIKFKISQECIRIDQFKFQSQCYEWIEYGSLENLTKFKLAIGIHSAF